MVFAFCLLPLDKHCEDFLGDYHVLKDKLRHIRILGIYLSKNIFKSGSTPLDVIRSIPSMEPEEKLLQRKGRSTVRKLLNGNSLTPDWLLGLVGLGFALISGGIYSPGFCFAHIGAAALEQPQSNDLPFTEFHNFLFWSSSPRD